MTQLQIMKTSRSCHIQKEWELDFYAAAERLKKVVNRTPLMYNHNLSRKYQCNIFLKREDLQVVRSYKLAWRL